MNIWGVSSFGLLWIVLLWTWVYMILFEHPFSILLIHILEWNCGSYGNTMFKFLRNIHEYWSGQPFPSPGDFPNPGIEPRSPALQADSFPAEPQGKTKNIEVGSLSLLQGIFLTQESNQGLLPCRKILYQLSYEGSPQKSHCWGIFMIWKCAHDKGEGRIINESAQQGFSFSILYVCFWMCITEVMFLKHSQILFPYIFVSGTCPQSGLERGT